jgi:hypothetical protein
MSALYAVAAFLLTATASHRPCVLVQPVIPAGPVCMDTDGGLIIAGTRERAARLAGLSDVLCHAMRSLKR